MSSRRRSKRPSFRPSGIPQSARTLDLATQFGQEIGAAQLANATSGYAPAAHIQQIVPGSNYRVQPRSAESAERMHQAKQGVDPHLGRRFETATEAAQYRRAIGSTQMSGAEFDAEARRIGSSRKIPAFMQGARLDGIGDDGKLIQGFRHDAFQRGSQIVNQMNLGGDK